MRLGSFAGLLVTELSGGLEAEPGQLQATQASLPGRPEAVPAAGLWVVCLGKPPRLCCPHSHWGLTLGTFCKFRLALKQDLSSVAETLRFQSFAGSF